MHPPSEIFDSFPIIVLLVSFAFLIKICGKLPSVLLVVRELDSKLPSFNCCDNVRNLLVGGRALFEKNSEHFLGNGAKTELVVEETLLSFFFFFGIAYIFC